MKVYNKQLHSGLFRPLGITGADSFSKFIALGVDVFLFGTQMKRKGKSLRIFHKDLLPATTCYRQDAIEDIW